VTDTQIERRKSGLTLDLVVEMTGFPPTDIALIAKTVAVGASLQELAVFLHACRQLKLDPLLRQAYWIRRRDRATGEMKGALQVGIDGFRAIAEGSGVYAGAEPPEFRGRKEWKYKQEPIVVPECCRVVVWKIVGNHKGAFTGEAWWDEFVPEQSQAFMWAKMPRLMLAKVAEAQALRKAFPALLASLDMADERDGYDGELEVVNPPQNTLAPQDSLRDSQDARRKLNAAKYDQIFGEPEAPPAQPEAEPEPEPEPEAPRAAPREAPPALDPERGQLWEQHRQLAAQAQAAKLRVQILRNTATAEQLQAANETLQRQINQALDKQLAESKDDWAN